MNNSLKILIWDAVILPKNTTPNPVIYVQSNPYLRSILNQTVQLHISGNDSVGPNTDYEALVRSSADIAGYRPNFEHTYDMIGLVLKTQWQGYPLSNDLGVVSVLSPKDIVIKTIPSVYEAYHGPGTFTVYRDLYFVILFTVIIICVILS